MTDAIERAVECETCGDSGWERRECTGDQACGRRRRHLPHLYVVVCECRPINRTFQEKQERRRAA